MKVIWGPRLLYHLKARLWLPIYLLLTFSFYLEPIFIYLISNLSEVDLWPIKFIWGQIFTIRKPIYDFLSNFHWQFLSISYNFWVIFELLFRIWPWPYTIKGHLRSNNYIPLESPYMTSYLTFIDTNSLYYTVSEKIPVIISRAAQNSRIWPFKGQGHPSIFFLL